MDLLYILIGFLVWCIVGLYFCVKYTDHNIAPLWGYLALGGPFVYILKYFPDEED